MASQADSVLQPAITITRKTLSKEDTAKVLSALKSAVSIYKKFVTERLIHDITKLKDTHPIQEKLPTEIQMLRTQLCLF